MQIFATTYEWADFEILPNRVGTRLPSQASGSYVREALLNGISMQANQQFNPFKLGVIGSSDTHGNSGEMRSHLVNATPGTVGEFTQISYYNKGSVAGLAGVWAEENTRLSGLGSKRCEQCPAAESANHKGLGRRR